jgi:hypothetical protein
VLQVETSFDWYRTTDSNRALFAADFMALFIDVIGKAINEVGSRRPGLAAVSKAQPYNPMTALCTHDFAVMQRACPPG